MKRRKERKKPPLGSLVLFDLADSGQYRKKAGAGDGGWLDSE